MHLLVSCRSGWGQFKDFGETSSINNLAGTISWIFGMLLWLTSANWVRRRFYQSFHSIHMLGFLGYVLFALLHYPGMWPSIVPGDSSVIVIVALMLSCTCAFCLASLLCHVALHCSR